MRLFKGYKLSWKIKAALIFLGIAFVSLVVYSIVRVVNNFFENNYLQFNQVISVILKKPIEIKKREAQKVEVVLDYPDEIDTSLKKYICEKFGTYDCKAALAIASAESGLGETKYHVNNDGTIDIGIFQINQVHWNQPGCSPKELFDAYKNVDCAYSIWQNSGWNPWVVYEDGSYIRYIK